MSDGVAKLMSLLRKDEYDKEIEQNNILSESQSEYYAGIRSDINRRTLPQRRFAYELAYAKEIICECIGDLYVSSLVIDDADKYSDSLKSEMRHQCMELMENANNVKDLYEQFKGASLYVKEIFPLIESIMETKTDDDVEKFDGNVFINDNDKKLIEKFEEDNGKTAYATELQDRIIDVYKKEQECGEERKEKVQNIIDSLTDIANKSKDKSETISESIQHGMNKIGSVPSSLFNAIFVNKSKMILNENVSANLVDNSEEILVETICTYTLLECISSLGLKTYSDDEVRQMKYEFYTQIPGDK